MLAIVAPAAAILVRVGDVEVQPLVAALKHAPVQLDGRPNPSLTGGQVRALRAQIARKDPGRIAIAIVTPFSTKATGDLSEAISEQINRNGVVVVVSGYNYHVSTTWGSGTGAGNRLGTAVDRPGDSLYVQMQRTIDSFARADARAGHPGANSSEQNAPSPSQGQVTAPTNTSNGAPGSSGSPSSSSGGGSGGLIAALIGVAIVLLVAAVPVTKAVRRSMRSSHWRKEEASDVHAQAQADFIKLGEDIGALDIDSSMPNASAAAKEEYSRAIDCYQDAEKRLQKPDDNYQFERALDALKRGRAHLQAAEQMFNASEQPAMAGAHGASAQSAESNGKMVDQLAALATLHERGELTDAEFDEQKRRLLSG
jgi:hypothetical protein